MKWGWARGMKGNASGQKGVEGDGKGDKLRKCRREEEKERRQIGEK